MPSQSNTTGLNAGTPAETRHRNRRVLLSALRTHGSLSRAELARLSGLTPPAIANIVHDLMIAGLVYETGRRKTSRGQPPIVISINDDGGYAVGVRIDAAFYDFSVADLGGKALETGTGKVESNDEAYLLELLAGIYRTVADRYGPERCLGLGIVTPGPFDAIWPGVATPGSIPALQTFSIVPKLAEMIGNDVFLENDATAAALSAKLYGHAKNLTNFFFVFIGEGVGGGIVINGKQYAGRTGNAGEFGHMIVDPNGPQCYCGNRGCLGQYLSMRARREFLADAPNAPRKEREWLKRAAEALSIALAGVENLLDPELIILGGVAPKELINDLANELKELRPSVREGLSKPRLKVSKLGDKSAAFGAHSLPIMAALSPR